MEGGPLMRCQDCGDTYNAPITEDYDGIPGFGATTYILDDDAYESECCGAEGRAVKGSENGFVFDDEDYSPDEKEVWVIQREETFPKPGEPVAWVSISGGLTFDEAERQAEANTHNFGLRIHSMEIR